MLRGLRPCLTDESDTDRVCEKHSIRTLRDLEPSSGDYSAMSPASYFRDVTMKRGCEQVVLNLRSQGNHRDATRAVITAARLHGLRLQLLLLLFPAGAPVSKAARDTSAVSACRCAPPSPKALNIHIWLVTHIWQKKKGKHQCNFTKRRLRGTTGGLNRAADST